MAALRPVHEDRTLRLATWEGLLFAVWSDAPDLNQMRMLGSALRAQSRSHPRASALMNIVVRGTPNFSEPVRQEALRLARDPTLTGLGTAHLILMTGLTGVATRAFLSTVALVSSPAAPVKVFSDPTPAADWMANRLSATNHPPTPQDILTLQTRAITDR